MPRRTKDETQKTKAIKKLAKFVKSKTTITGDGNNNTVFACLKFVGFLTIIDQVILGN